MYDVEQGQQTELYQALATSLGKKFIIKHKDKDVRLHAAFCITHVLRICAPHEPPYEHNQLWVSHNISLYNSTSGLFENCFDSDQKKCCV